MAGLPKLVLQRNYVLATSKGHSIAFVKGEPTYVPPVVYQEAIAIGAQPEGGTAIDILEDAPAVPIPMSDGERAAAVLAAIESLVATNQSKDFTAGGRPNIKSVERITGFDVDAREVEAVWQTYHDKQAGV